ncbi:MAG: BACON domain-containing protein [Bacteroidales bacterium]|nr:BACON domain-containing protein [Bacteroidales bacterium]
MKIKNFIIAILAMGAFCACEDEAPVLKEESKIDLSENNVVIESKGGEAAVSVKANCDWKVSTSEDWVDVTPIKGTSATTLITVAVDTNKTDKDRIAQIFVRSEGLETSFTISQAVYQAEPATPDNPDAPEVKNSIRTAEAFAKFINDAVDMTETDVWTVDADIDMEGAKLAPAAAFSGVLNGNNHRIYNFTVESDNEYVGLILNNYGTIKNITFGSADGKKYDGRTVISAVEGKGGNHTGLVAVNSGKMEGVVNFANIKFTASTTPTDYVGTGGIAGGAANGAVFEGCVNYGKLEGSGEVKVEFSFGGILGIAKLVAGDLVTVSNCVNNADIDLNVYISKVLMAGGIIGRTNFHVVIENCTNNGNITYTTEVAPKTWASFGGIGGSLYNGSEVIGCRNNGAVSSDLCQVNRMGGILGVLNSGGLIKNCVNAADVSVRQEAANANWQSIGGILGFQEKANADPEVPNLVEGNVNKGRVSFFGTNATTHANKLNIGGVVGMTSLKITVKDNENQASVTAVNNASGVVFAGGVIGAFYKGEGLVAEGNINSGNVTLKGNSTSNALGGVIGGSLVATNSISGNSSSSTLTCNNAALTGAVVGTNIGEVKDNKAAGIINGTVITAENVASLASGSGSSVAAVNTTLAD